jgi:hypothetical protein
MHPTWTSDRAFFPYYRAPRKKDFSFSIEIFDGDRRIMEVWTT